MRSLQFPALFLFHIGPGLLGTLAYVLISGPVQTAGYPPIAALLLAAGVVLLPAELLILRVMSDRDRAAGREFIPYRESLPFRAWVVLVPALFIAAFIGSGIFGLLDALIQSSLFSWAPSWFLRPIDLDRVGDYSRSAWVVTISAYLVLNTFVGPLVEELYFRGWLLARMERFGSLAPLLNAALFSLYHLWLPWAFFSRLAAVAPFVYAVRSKRNVYLGMAVHMLLNGVGGGLVVAQVLAKL